MTDDELVSVGVAVYVGDVLQIAVPLFTETVDDYGQRRTVITQKMTRLRVREVRTDADGTKTLLFEPAS